MVSKHKERAAGQSTQAVDDGDDDSIEVTRDAVTELGTH